jgi:hypothetical protein
MFEVYLQCFRERQPSGVSPQDLYRLFRPYVRASAESGSLSESCNWTVEYGDAESCELHLTPLRERPDLVYAICVYRPCGDHRLWQSILQAMQQWGLVLYWPGSCRASAH